MMKTTQQKSIAWYIEDFTPLVNPYVETIQNGLFVTADNATFSRSDGDLIASFAGTSVAGVSNGDADSPSYARISPNSKYTFEIMIGGSGTLSSGDYNINFFDSANTLISTLTGTFTPGGAKKQVTHTFLTPVNAYYYEIEFLVGGTASAIVRFNDFLLYEGSYLSGGEQYLADLPAEIGDSIKNYIERLTDDGNPPNNFQVWKLTEFYKSIYYIAGVLPDFLAHPDFSFNLANPASTKFYNAGSFNGGDGVIQNTNTGDLVKDGLIDTSAFVGNEFIATTMPNVTGQFSIISKAQPLSFSVNRDLWGNEQNENVRMTLRNTAKLRYTIRAVDDVVESSNSIVSTGFNTLAIGQSDIEAFSQVINSDTSARTTAAKTFLPIGNQNVSFLRDSPSTEYRGTIKYLMTFKKSLTNQEVQAINNIN